MSKTWFITGCSRGLGRALAEAVVASGDRVVATARDVHSLEALVAKAPSRVIALPLDITSELAARDAVQVALEHFGAIDVLVNNAGYGNVAPIEDTSLEDFRAQIETNLMGTIIVTKAVLPSFRERRAGHFLQISSIGGRGGATGRGPYSAAKFGIEGFSEVLAIECAPLGVRVTIIEPGGFRTDFAGSSTRLDAGHTAYAQTVGTAVEMQRGYNGKQPGDPARAAQAMIEVTKIEQPPLRLVLGSDAYARAESIDAARLAELRAWRSTSISTDFPREA